MDPMVRKIEIRDTVRRVKEMVLGMDEEEDSSMGFVEDFESAEQSGVEVAQMSPPERSRLLIRSGKQKTDQLIKHGLDRTLGTRTELLREVSEWMNEKNAEDVAESIMAEQPEGSRDGDLDAPIESVLKYMDNTKVRVEKLFDEFQSVRWLAEQLFSTLKPSQSEREELETRFRRNLEKLHVELENLRFSLADSHESITQLRDELEEKNSVITRLENALENAQFQIERLKISEEERDSDRSLRANAQKIAKSMSHFPFSASHVRGLFVSSFYALTNFSFRVFCRTEFQDVLAQYLKLSAEHEAVLKLHPELAKPKAGAGAGVKKAAGTPAELTSPKGVQEDSVFLNESAALTDPIVDALVRKTKDLLTVEYEAKMSDLLSKLSQLEARLNQSVERNKQLQEECTTKKKEDGLSGSCEEEKESLAAAVQRADNLQAELDAAYAKIENLGIHKGNKAGTIASLPSTEDSAEDAITEDGVAIQSMSKNDSKKLYKVITESNEQIRILSKMVEDRRAKEQETKKQLRVAEHQIADLQAEIDAMSKSLKQSSKGVIAEHSNESRTTTTKALLNSLSDLPRAPKSASNILQSHLKRGGTATPTDRPSSGFNGAASPKAHSAFSAAGTVMTTPSPASSVSQSPVSSSETRAPTHPNAATVAPDHRTAAVQSPKQSTGTDGTALTVSVAELPKTVTAAIPASGSLGKNLHVTKPQPVAQPPFSTQLHAEESFLSLPVESWREPPGLGSGSSSAQSSFRSFAQPEHDVTSSSALDSTHEELGLLSNENSADPPIEDVPAIPKSRTSVSAKFRTIAKLSAQHARSRKRVNLIEEADSFS
eukprot:ANDGO_00067.mRNA.1 hypothetical protein